MQNLRYLQFLMLFLVPSSLLEPTVVNQGNHTQTNANIEAGVASKKDSVNKQGSWIKEFWSNPAALTLKGWHVFAAGGISALVVFFSLIKGIRLTKDNNQLKSQSCELKIALERMTNAQKEYCEAPKNSSESLLANFKAKLEAINASIIVTRNFDINCDNGYMNFFAAIDEAKKAIDALNPRGGVDKTPTHDFIRSAREHIFSAELEINKLKNSLLSESSYNKKLIMGLEFVEKNVKDLRLFVESVVEGFCSNISLEDCLKWVVPEDYTDCLKFYQESFSKNTYPTDDAFIEGGGLEFAVRVAQYAAERAKTANDKAQTSSVHAIDFARKAALAYSVARDVYFILNSKKTSILDKTTLGKANASLCEACHKAHENSRGALEHVLTLTTPPPRAPKPQ